MMEKSDLESQYLPTSVLLKETWC